VNRVAGDRTVALGVACSAGGRPRGRALLAVALTVFCAVLAFGSAQAFAAGRRLGVKPTIPSGASTVGALAGSSQIQATVALTPSDPTALAAYAAAVSTPGSPDYHQYLSVAQFAQRFGATPSQIAAVRSSLASRGLTVGSVTANGLSLNISGSATKVGGAFSTSFKRYRLSSGRTVYANTSAPAVASSVAGHIQGIFGLDTLPQLQPEGLGRAQPSTPHAAQASEPSATAVTACADARAEATKDTAFTAGQMAAAYGYPNLYGQGDVGAGTGVALYELEPFDPSDIGAYQSCYGTSATVDTTTVDDGAGTGAGTGEAALDIEQVIGLAPRASINVYEAPNTDQGALDNYEAIIANDTEKVISTSWGVCESKEGTAAAQSENTLFEEAAAQGQTIFAAAGDNGADDCHRLLRPALAVDDPASQPFVTGVGGTSLSSSPRTEVVWNDGNNGGATGGGVSTLWPQPSYQAGRVLSQSAISCGAGVTTCREVPDVSADANEDTGMVVFWNGSGTVPNQPVGWQAFGGTSIAAPMWAALAALADASSTCAGTSIGFINPALYDASAQDFNDVTSGNNSLGGVTGYTAQPGYDMTTGLGTPIAGALAPALCGDLVTVTSPGAQSSKTGTVVSVAVKASSSAGSALNYSATGLPAGLTINPATGVISGTVTTGGTSTVTVVATDAAGSMRGTSFTWTVVTPAPPPPPPPPPPPQPKVTITASSAQFGQVGAAAQLMIAAADSGGLTLTYTATGLPSGLTINPSTGVISGTPRQASNASVTVSASDGHGGSASSAFNWTIAPSPRVTHAKLTKLSGKMARLSLAVTTGSSRIAIEQLQISASGGPLKFAFTRKALANALKAAARSARATHATAKVQHAGITVSYTAAARGTASLVLPLELKHAIKHRLTVRVKVVIVDAADVQAPGSFKLAL
jgi:subtilase family serine protease